MLEQPATRKLDGFFRLCGIFLCGFACQWFNPGSERPGRDVELRAWLSVILGDVVLLICERN